MISLTSNRTKSAPLDIQIRSMAKNDLEEIIQIQKHCYTPLFWEKIDIFNEKLSLFPEGCFVAAHNDHCIGYLFSHPWILGKIAPLNQSLQKLPARCNCLHLHDCSVTPVARDRGIGYLLVQKVTFIAATLDVKYIQLVSVQKSIEYWSRFGFAVQNSFKNKSKTHLADYGTDATMMSMRVSD